MTDSLWVITSFFNPSGYASKLVNYERFRAGLEAVGVRSITVECAFGGAPFVLAPTADVVHVRGRDVMWQKERLLNVALSALPAHCDKVAWLDCDLLFLDPEWARNTAKLLDTHAIVQPFTDVVRLSEGCLEWQGGGDAFRSFASVYQEDPSVARRGQFEAHGHTGFGWAARRDLLARHGLYDACVAGSADHMMAHAFIGDFQTDCIGRIFGKNARHRAHFEGWGAKVFGDTAGRVGATPGRVLHLWHGEMGNRNYVLRHKQLAAFGFDPEKDLRVGPAGAWEWASLKPELGRWAIQYFQERREDG